MLLHLPLQIEAGLGLSESFYHYAISAFSIGEFLGAVIGGITTGRVPFWYSAMGALLCHIVGFIMYASSVSGWMIIVARVLSGTFVGLQSVISFTYFGVSYQYYLELLGPEGRRREEAKTTRVKDLLFAFYAVAANLATLFGPGLAVRCWHTIHAIECLYNYTWGPTAQSSLWLGVLATRVPPV